MRNPPTRCPAYHPGHGACLHPPGHEGGHGFAFDGRLVMVVPRGSSELWSVSPGGYITAAPPTEDAAHA